MNNVMRTALVMHSHVFSDWLYYLEHESVEVTIKGRETPIKGYVELANDVGMVLLLKVSDDTITYEFIPTRAILAVTWTTHGKGI